MLAVSAQIRVAPLEKNNCVDRVTTVEYGKHYPDGSSGRITIIVFQKGGETTFKMDRDGKLLLHPLFPDGVVYPARASCDTITFLTNGEDTARTHDCSQGKDGIKGSCGILLTSRPCTGWKACATTPNRCCRFVSQSDRIMH